MHSKFAKLYKTVRLPEALRVELSKPQGILVEGKHDKVSEEVYKAIRNSKAPKVITVGDVVTRSVTSKGIRPDVSIVDGKTLRGTEEKLTYKVDATYELANPAGLIVADAWKLIEKALKENRKIKIVVDGEEDLLGIPVVMLAPTGSLVLYGQPDQGIVIVTVNNQVREFAKSILSRMEEQSA